jgi:hypothetical protein
MQYRYPGLKSLIEAAHVESQIRQHGQLPEACMELRAITMPDRAACNASTSPGGCRLAAMEKKWIALNPEVTEIYKDAEVLISSKSWTVV